MVVRVGRAGVTVIHDGPATPLLSDTEVLYDLATTVVELCRQMPPDDPLPQLGPAPYPERSDAVATAFLEALASHDPAAALAYLDPRMFDRSRRFDSNDGEPLPQDIVGPIERRRVWPVRCPPIHPQDAKVGVVDSLYYDLILDFGDNRSHIGLDRVNMCRYGSQWVVVGYVARGRVVLGWDQP
jgi:hypothetical protein